MPKPDQPVNGERVSPALPASLWTRIQRRRLMWRKAKHQVRLEMAEFDAKVRRLELENAHTQREVRESADWFRLVKRQKRREPVVSSSNDIVLVLGSRYMCMNLALLCSIPAGILGVAACVVHQVTGDMDMTIWFGSASGVAAVMTGKFTYSAWRGKRPAVTPPAVGTDDKTGDKATDENKA